MESDRVTAPNFLGIGAPRCGTTWMHQMLRRHPDVWLPPIKEVHYFDSLDPRLNRRCTTRLTHRLRRHLFSRIGHYVATAVSPVLTTYKGRTRPDFGWDIRYFSPGGDLEWYRRLFESKARQFVAVGEVTPAYFALDKEIIEIIATELQVQRFIVMLRDPIDALWSGIARAARETGMSLPAVQVESEASAQGFNTLGPRLYGQNLARWFSVFDRSCFHMVFYEDLAADPVQTIDDVARFLRVRPLSECVDVARLREPVNVTYSSRKEMPKDFERTFARLVVDDLELLAQLVDGPAADWLARARRVT